MKSSKMCAGLEILKFYVNGLKNVNPLDIDCLLIVKE